MSPAVMPCQDAWIVDDSAAARRLLGALIGRAGFSVVLFESGADAARAITDADPHPALIVLDMQMEGLDGCTTARAIRRAGYAGPIALISATTSPALVRRALRAGADAALRKDAGFAGLRAWVAERFPATDDADASAAASPASTPGG